MIIWLICLYLANLIHYWQDATQGQFLKQSTGGFEFRIFSKLKSPDYPTIYLELGGEEMNSCLF